MSENQRSKPFVPPWSRRNQQTAAERPLSGLGAWLSNRRISPYSFIKSKARSERGSSPAPQTLAHRPRTANPEITALYDGPSFIDRLPPELLLNIFHFDNPVIKRLIKLTHVCHKWRTIASETGSLWTSIEIDSCVSDKALRNLISLLNIQLERTRDAPLDVVWHLRGEASHIPVVKDLLQRKGPFHRWRTLELYIVTLLQGDLLPTDGFPNLESLVVQPMYDHPIIQTLERTTTSKLKVLDIRHWGTNYLAIEYRYSTMLKHITHLVLPTMIGEYSVPLPPLPVNIIELEASMRSSHLFPHVKRYTLAHGVFQPNHEIDLRRLTTLIITRSLDIKEHCQLVLPSLIHFVCVNMFLADHARLEAPSLETLKLRYDIAFSPEQTRRQISNFRMVLRHPGFLLAPTKILSLEVCLATDLILAIVARSPHLENLELNFSNWVNVSRVTEAIEGTKAGTEIFCPRLTELRLNFNKHYKEAHVVSWWKEWATRVVEGRRGLAVIPRIYAALGGEGTAVLLA